MHPKSIQKFIPVVDTLHVNLTKDLNPNTDFVLSNHNPTNLLTITRNNAKDYYYSAGFTLERVHQHKNRHYHLLYHVKTHTGLFASLYLDLKAGFDNQKQLIPLHLSNAILYTDWTPVLTNFLAAYELKISTYAQLHIALDTNENAIKRFYKLQDSDSFIMNHARQLSDSVVVRGKRGKGGTREDSLYIGSAKSAKHTCIYNKTKDIATKDKQYISNWQHVNGLDITSDVYRVELRLTYDVFKAYSSLYVNEDGEPLTKYQKERLPASESTESYRAYTAIRNTPVDYTRLTNPHYLTSLFQAFTNIDFRYKDNRNISRCTRFDFVKSDIYQKENIMKQTAYKDSKSNDFRIQKQSIKLQIELFKSTFDPVYIEAAAKCATEYHLEETLNQLIRHYKIQEVVETHFPAGYFADTTIAHGLYLK